MTTPKFCTNCGDALKSGVNFCGSCGCSVLGGGSSEPAGFVQNTRSGFDEGGDGHGELTSPNDDESICTVLGGGNSVVESYNPKMTLGDHAKLWIPTAAIIAIAWIAIAVNSGSSANSQHSGSRQTERVQQSSIVGRWSGQSVNGWPMTMRVFDNGRYSLEMLSDLGANGEWSQEGRHVDFYQNGGMIFRGTLSENGMRLSTVDAMRLRTGAWSRM